METVLLGLGSNLGDRRTILSSAWGQIAEIPETETISLSKFHETRAVGGPEGQPDFLNAVGLVRTNLDPEIFLQRLLEIENRFGRIRREHWGPRTLDLDILLFGDRIIKTSTLIVPHPEMLHRNFVLVPALEIAADRIHPQTGQTLRKHAADR